MIEYPDDSDVLQAASACGLPPPVLIRDLVRIVEVLNLRQQNFFNKTSVLAGSMGLRCFDSPRFTVFDADFSTSTDTIRPETELRKMLAYSDDSLDISVESFHPHDLKGSAWEASPINFAPAFTALVPAPNDRQFKADISFRGVMLDGLERDLSVPYDLGLWTDTPSVWVMDPHETVAEKILGWCAHRQLKHYADLGFIAISAEQANGAIRLQDALLRNTTAAKLEVMRKHQPGTYQGFPSFESLVDELAKPARFPVDEWRKMMYVLDARNIYKPGVLVTAVQNLLVPRLR